MGAATHEGENAEGRQRHPGHVKSTPGSRDRHSERTEELDRDRNAERDAGDSVVEGDVHHGEHDPERHRKAQLPTGAPVYMRAPDGNQHDGR